jgi:hypothetical protein
VLLGIRPGPAYAGPGRDVLALRGSHADDAQALARILQSGNLQDGFNWYVSQYAARPATIRGELPALPKTGVRTCVRRGDRLGEYFADLDPQPRTGVGHFPRREDPDRAAAEIDRLFADAVVSGSA